MGSSQADMAYSREKGFPDPSPKGRRWDACALWRGLSRATFIVSRPARCSRGPGWYIIPTAARSTPPTIYTDLLQHYSIAISMSQAVHPWDNEMATSFLKTLKYEEVCPQEYRNLAEALLE